MAWWRDTVLSQISDVISDVSGQLPEFSVRTAIRVLSVLGITGSALVRLDVDSYVQHEEPIAKDGLLANIGPNGTRASGAFVSPRGLSSFPPTIDSCVQPGVVVASPSTVNPNYYYSWRRDSALVFKTLIDQYTSGQDNTLGPLIDDYVAAEAEFQQVSNPSGSLQTGGLGEPKFYVNITAFEDGWGRPQRGESFFF
jgi:glucoamylase